MGLKAGLQILQKVVTNYADDAVKIATTKGDDVTQILTNNKNTTKFLTSDVIEITNKRASLKQKLLNGTPIKNNKAIKIPKGRLRAQRPGFDESLKAYEDIIKNNQDEIKAICNKYQRGLINEQEFANEYARFLSAKMNMPYYPELKQVIDARYAGGMQNSTNILYYNLSDMNRMSDLTQTITHEMHHFLQQKEIFSTISIEKFSKLKATADVKAILKENPSYYKTQQEIFEAIDRQTKSYIKDYKDAGWEKIIEKYPKNTNPNSPYYKRAQDLLKAELNYVDGNVNTSKYMSNLIEKEAYEIGTHTQIEFEHLILDNITKRERDIAIEIYDCLNSPSYSEISRAREIIEIFNTNPYNIVEIIKEAKKMGLNDAYSIIEAIF